MRTCVPFHTKSVAPPLSSLAFRSASHGTSHSLDHHRRVDSAFLCNYHHPLVLPCFSVDNPLFPIHPHRELHGSEFKRLTRDSITFSFIVMSEEEENSIRIITCTSIAFLKMEKHQLLFAYDRNILH
ncbi:unnamed protein product [Vicia faba]|uniref:Uncharacterized protein n=1 Tax=Vicia faba TaxID=3906 RepID=A0AAV0ZAQ8_VICFA|nr:unnamed protein product [Vicia faba]